MSARAIAAAGAVPATTVAPATATAVHRRAHLDAVDLVRVLTIALVIGVHALAILPATQTLGALTIVLHTSREVFFLITGFVLMHGYGRGAVRWPTFWRRRFVPVLAAYLAWSAVYFFVNNFHGRSLTSSGTLADFDTSLLVGTAGYHLYFLLVSMQIYLLTPLLRRLLAATRNHHVALLVACGAFQLVFSLAVQRAWAPGPILTQWIDGPDAVLPSYLLFVVAGGVAAWHAEALLDWTRRHLSAVAGISGLSVAATLGTYALQLHSGQAPTDASAVFQPAVALESLGVAWGFLAAGLLWTAHRTPLRRLVMAASDASFGIYLVHPLLLQGLAVVATAAGWMAAAAAAPAWLVAPVMLLGVLPATYLVSGLFAALVRRTPLSLALAGRSRLRPRAAAEHARARATAARSSSHQAGNPLALHESAAQNGA
ncbi:MAG TPA: acyltransferase [Candidatus Dormibacteraeota bacterium]|nr:acyltransferase [Candidatus Dormibacteraeota bacterium]